MDDFITKAMQLADEMADAAVDLGASGEVDGCLYTARAALLAHLEGGDMVLSDAVRDALQPTSNLSFERMAFILDEDPYGALSEMAFKEAARTLRRCAKAEAVWGGAARASDALKP